MQSFEITPISLTTPKLSKTSSNPNQSLVKQISKTSGVPVLQRDFSFSDNLTPKNAQESNKVSEKK